jgi:hypothetical protein
MARRWVLASSKLADLPEDRCLELACAVLQRFRSDGSDRLDSREVSHVATESTFVSIRQIGTDRSRVEAQTLTVPAAEGQGGARQLNLRVSGLQGHAGLVWRIGDLDDPAVHLQGEIDFAREVAALFERLFGFRPELQQE